MKPRLFALLPAAVLLLWAIAGLWIEELVPFYLPIGLGLGLMVIADFIFAVRLPRPVVDRELPRTVVLLKPFTVTLTIHGTDWRNLELYDGIPDDFQTDSQPIRVKDFLTQTSRDTVVIPYTGFLTERGLKTFDGLDARIKSPWGFWEKVFKLPLKNEIQVFPPLRVDGTRLGLLAGETSSGPHMVRRRGLGLEFHQLREYRIGDMMRLVDWKASGRQGKLIVKEFQEEQNQEVFFLLDTGYRMHAKEGSVTHFDRSLEALLALSHAALLQGDAVGVAAFGPQSRWINPQKGISHLHTIRKGLYDLQASPQASSPAAILETLGTRIKRRTLIILMSNLREEDAQGLEPHIPQLLRKHLLLTLWIRETLVDECLTGPFKNLNEALTASSARTYLDDRTRFMKIWEAQGIFVVDTDVQKLTADLVASYWSIKKKGRL